MAGRDGLREIDSFKVRRLREGLMLSQEELAWRVGVTHNTIYRIEHAHPAYVQPRVLRALASALEVSKQDLRPSERVLHVIT